MAKVPVLLALFPFLGWAQPRAGPIAAIDFYGSAPVDFARLRAAFPYQVGAPFKFGRIALADTPAEFQKLVGDNRFSVCTVFIPDLHGAVLYIDVEPAAASVLVWNPEPVGAEKLPPEILALYEQDEDRAINGGIYAGDETTEGYSLSKDPVMRANELKLIDYARAHAAAVYSVLNTSASRRDRIAAAWIAGYTPQDKAQIAALLGAVTDPNPIVRNNSIRVLAVLAFHDPNVARQIPPDPFIPMLHSLDWTDRNKALFLLVFVTTARDQKTLESLRRQAIEPLRQMSHWTAWGHASMALTLVGRIAGIPEERLQTLLASHNAAAILAALDPK
ncbi:MAG: hypothetical protein ACLQGV_14905 [Bryobacteraceae bacterium]